MRWLAVIYSLIIIFIIIVADSGQYRFIFQLVHQVPFGDKFGHFILIGLLALVINLALQGRKIQVFNYSLLQGSVIIAILVMLEELSQFFIKNRTFDLGDLLFDFIGIVVSGYVTVYILRDRNILNSNSGN